jgi:hypothetical protein
LLQGWVAAVEGRRGERIRNGLEDNRGRRPAAGGRSNGFCQRLLATPRLTVFSQADIAEASAQGAVGRCPAALRALIPGQEQIWRGQPEPRILLAHTTIFQYESFRTTFPSAKL